MVLSFPSLTLCFSRHSVQLALAKSGSVKNFLLYGNYDYFFLFSACPPFRVEFPLNQVAMVTNMY